jgi:N-acetylmuramoyl-L-alanine amidase
MSLVRTPDTVSGDYTLLGKGGLRRGFTETFLDQVPDGTLRGSNYAISSIRGRVSPEAEAIIKREYAPSGLAVNFGDQSLSKDQKSGYVSQYSSWSPGLKSRIKPVLRDFDHNRTSFSKAERGLEKTHLKVAATRDIAFVATGDFNSILTGESSRSRSLNEALIVKDKETVKDINAVLDLVLSTGFSTKTNVGAELAGKLTSGNVFVTGPGASGSDDEVVAQTLGTLSSGDRAVVSFSYITNQKTASQLISASKSGADITFVGQNPYGKSGASSVDETSSVIRSLLSAGISVRLQPAQAEGQVNMHKKMIATSNNVYVGSTNKSKTSAEHSLELGVIARGKKIGEAAISDALKEADAYGFVDVMSNPEKFLDILGGMQGYRNIKAQAKLGEFSDIIRPSFKLSSDPKTEITGETVYLPTQLPAAFHQNYASQNPKIYQSYFQTVNGSEPTGLRGHVLKVIDAQLADPGLGLHLNRLTGLDLYQQDRGVLGSGLAIFGRALDSLSGFHYMRQLEEIQGGSTRGSMRRLHMESYSQTSYVGPFENTANFLTETIASTASSIALYFGVSHAISLGLSHLEQLSTDNLVSHLYSPELSRNWTKDIPKHLLSVLPEGVEEVIKGAGASKHINAYSNLGQGVSHVLDEIITKQIAGAPLKDYSRINSMLAAELNVISAEELSEGIQFSEGEKKKRLEKFIGIENIEVGTPKEPMIEVGTPKEPMTKRVWSMDRFTQSGIGANVADSVGLLRKAESSLVEDVVIPLLNRFMLGDPKEKAEILEELSSLSRAPLGLVLNDGVGGGGSVTNIGVDRKSQAAGIWDKIASVVSANFLTANQDFAQGIGTPSDTTVKSRGADGILRPIKGSSIAINSFIGSGFVDIIRTTTKIGGIIQSAVTTRSFSLKQTMSGVYDDFYNSRAILKDPSNLHYALASKAAEPLGSIAKVRRGLFIAGSALIADRILDAYYLKPQGVDLLTQLTAEVRGDMGWDENRMARNEFTGVMPEVVKTGSLVAGGTLAGFMFAENIKIDGLADNIDVDKRFIKRFNYKFAALGAVGALFAAQGATSVAASYLNFIYQRGKNNGLHLSAEGSAVAGLFSSTVKREQQDPSTTAERIAAQTVLMRAAKEYTRPEVKSVRTTYTVAAQLPNPIFQLTFVSRRDPLSGITSYSGGFQLLPILGSGAIPTSPFGIRTGAPLTPSIQTRMLESLSASREQDKVGDPSTSSDPAVRARYNNEMALLASSSFLSSPNLLQFIPESQMLGALGTIGAISYLRSTTTTFASLSSPRSSSSFDALKDVVGFGVGQTERLVRLAQVPTLLLPNITKTFLQNLTASKTTSTLARFGPSSRVLGPYGLALAAGLSLSSLESTFGGAAAVSMLKAEHDIKQDPGYDVSNVVNAATAQNWYTASAVGFYYGSALQRSGAFASTKSFSAVYEAAKDLPAEEISKFTGNKYYQYTMGEIYSKAAGDPKLIDSMGIRTGMASRRLFKYGAFAYGLAYLASASGALSHDSPLSGLLDPLRLTGFDNLTEQQKLLLRARQKRGGERADGTVQGAVFTGSSFFFGNLFGLFNAGKLTGAYQDNPGMFVNLAGAFGFSESTYGPKPYVQSTTAFMDISNSQIDMRVLFGQSQESVKILKNVLRAPKNASSSQLYHALIGSTSRKTPVRLKGGFTSSELRAASGSSGIARALSIRQAEQMRLSHQRPEELEYSILYEQVRALVTGKAKGRVFMPGGTSKFSVFTSNIGFREATTIENILAALDPNSSLDASFYDSYERDVVTQQAREVPFLSTYIKTLTQAGSVYEKGSSPLGVIDLGLVVALTAGIAVSTYSLVTSLFAGFALSGLESKRARYTREIITLTDSYLNKNILTEVPNKGYGLSKRASLEYTILKPHSSNSIMAERAGTKSLHDLQRSYSIKKQNLVNYVASIDASTSHEQVAKIIKRHYVGDMLPTGFFGEEVDANAFISRLDEKLDSTLERGGVFNGIDGTDKDPTTTRLKKQRAYLKWIDEIDDSLTDHYFTKDDQKVKGNAYSRPITRLSPTAPPEVRNLRQTIGQLGYVGTLKEAVGGLGQSIFTLSAGSDLYSLGSALTEAGSKNTRDRAIASYYVANMLVETTTSFARFPLLRLLTANLVASAVVLAGSIIGLNVDRMTGGHGMKAAVGQVDKLNKNVYEPGLRSLGRLISNVTSQGPVSGFLTAIGAPFRLLDPLLTDLYIKSQQSPATAFLGQVLLPRPLEAFLLSQRGLLPSDTTILGRRFEEYTNAETEANRTQRYIQNLRRASSLGSSISDEILHPNTSGGSYSEYNSRLGIGMRYQTGGYATRIASETERPSRVSGLLRLGLRQKQANVNFTISAAYRGPDNVVQDMLSMFFPLQYLKAGYYQHGSSLKSFALVNAEAVGILISQLTNAVNFFDPTFDGSGANKLVSWVGRGFKPAAAGVATFLSARASSLNQVKISTFGLDQKLAPFAQVIKNAGSSIRNWGRLHLPGAGMASIAALLLQPMAQKTALLFGADEKTSNLIGSSTAIAAGIGSVALTPKFVDMAWSDASKKSASKKALGLAYRFTKQTTKASFFAVGGFVLGSSAALGIQAGLSAFDKPLDEEGYQKLLNVTTGVSTAASLTYFGALTAMNQRPGAEKKRVLGAPVRHLKEAGSFVSNVFSKLTPANKKILGIGLTAAVIGLGTTGVAKWWDGLTRKRRGEVEKQTLEGLAKTAATAGIIAGVVLPAVAVHDFTVGKHSSVLQSRFGKNLSYRFSRYKLSTGIKSVRATTEAIRSSTSTAITRLKSFMLDAKPTVTAVSRRVGGVGLSMSPLLFERRILELNETSTRIKREATFKQFFSTAATTALLALTRGKISHQLMSLGAFESILEQNETFDRMVNSYAKTSTLGDAAPLHTVTVVGLTGLFATTTLAAKKVSPRVLGKVGVGVMSALTAAELVQTSSKKHKGLEAIETHSSVVNRVADQISQDMSRAAMTSGFSAIRGFNPGGLAVAATGLLASVLFETPAFKDYLKKEYGRKFAESGATSRQNADRVFRSAARSSNRGAVAGTVISAGVLGTGAAMYLASLASLAAGAGAVVTAPAWLPSAAIALTIIAASASIGAAVGYKHGLDSELDATKKRVYGKGPARRAPRRLKPEYIDKVMPRRKAAVSGTSPAVEKATASFSPSFLDLITGARPAVVDEFHSMNLYGKSPEQPESRTNYPQDDPGQFGFTPNFMPAAFAEAFYKTVYTGFSLEPSDLSHVGSGYVTGKKGKNLQIIQTTAPEPSSRFNVSTNKSSPTKGFVWGSGWDSGPQWQWSAGYRNHGLTDALVMKNQSVYFSYTNIDYSSAGQHYTTDNLKSKGLKLDSKHWGTAAWDDNPVNKGQDYYAMTSKSEPTWGVSAADDVLFHNSRVKHLRITTLADAFTWIKSNYPQDFDFWMKKLSAPHTYTGVYGTGSSHTINHSPYLISEIAEYYGQTHFGVVKDLKSTSLASQSRLFGKTPSRSVLAKRMAARAFLLGISSPANVQRSTGGFVAATQSIFAGLKSAPAQANFFGSLNSDVAKSFERGDPLAAAAQVALGTGFGYGLDALFKSAAPKFGATFASGLAVAKPVLLGLAAREGSNFLMRMARLGLYGSPEDNEQNSEYIPDAAIDTTSNVIGVGTALAVGAKSASSIVKAVKGFSAAAKTVTGFSTAAAATGKSLQGFVKAAATFAQAKVVTASAKILLPALAIVLGTGSFTPVGKSEPDINKNPEMFRLPAPASSSPSHETSLVKPSFMDSLFGIKPAAASEQELIDAAKARRDALLTTFVIDKTKDSDKPPQWESREPKKVQPKSWRERLFEWTGQKLRQLGRGVRGAVRSAGNALEDFGNGVTDFFMGSYDESMVALAAISSLESGHAQGRANVAQSVLNRQYAAIKYGLNYGQKGNDIGSLIVADGQYQPVRDGGSRGKAAWAKAAKTGSVEDYITAISMAPSVGGNRQRAREMFYSALKQISDPKLQQEARRQVGPRIDFESLDSHAKTKRGGIKKVTDAYGHVFGFMMGSEGINYGRTATTVAAFPTREGGLFSGAGITGARIEGRRLGLMSISGGAGDRVLGPNSTIDNTGLHHGSHDLSRRYRGLRVRDYVITAPSGGRASDLGQPVPLPLGYSLVPRVVQDSGNNDIVEFLDPKSRRVVMVYTHLIMNDLVQRAAREGKAISGGTIIGGQGTASSRMTPHVDFIGDTAAHNAFIRTVTRARDMRPQPTTAASSSAVPSVQTPVRPVGPNNRRANQKDWSSQTSKRPGRIVIAAGHADDHSGAPGERAFNMRLLNRLEQRLDAAGLAGRVSIYRPGGIVAADDPRSQWSIALRTAQQGNYYLELHGDRGDSQGRTGIIVPSPKDKRFRTNAQSYNPLDEDLAAAYGSFSKSHRVAADNKAIGVAARGGRILEVTTITPEVNRIMQSGDQKKINALLDSYLNDLLPILQRNFGSGRTSPASRRRVQAPQASLAPSTSQSMAQSSVEVVAAIPVEEQAALLAGTLSIMQQAAEQTSKLEEDIMSAPIAVNPDVHGKTRDNADAVSDPLSPKVREVRVPEVATLEKVGNKRVVDIQTAIPVSVYQAKVSNGNIPFGDQLQTSHEPMLLGDYDGNPNTPYGVVQSIHGLA